MAKIQKFYYNSNMEKKVCTKCGEEKDISEFYLHRPECKICIKEYKKRHRDEYTEYERQRRKKNPEHIKELRRKYYKINPEKRKEQQARYFQKHKAKIYDKDRKRQNTNEYKEYRKRYWSKYKEREGIKEKKRDYDLIYAKQYRQTDNYKRSLPDKMNKNKERNVLKISDAYIGAILRLSVKIIKPFPEFIESKRAEIKIKRLIKTKKNENIKAS